MKNITFIMVAITTLPTIFVGSVDILDHAHTVQHAANIITPQVGSYVEQGLNVSTGIEINYLTLNQSNTSFATSGISTGGAPDLEQGATYNMNYKFYPGFRATLGVTTESDGWSALLTYLQNHSKANPITTEPIDLGLELKAEYPLGVTNPITSATGSNAITFEAAKLEIGREFYLSTKTTSKPFCGPKAAWIKQDLLVEYTEAAKTINASQTVRDFAVGINVGNISRYLITPSFSLIAKNSIALLSSRCKNSHKISETDGATETVAHNIYDKTLTIVLNTALELGLTYDIWVDNDAYHFAVFGALQGELYNGNAPFNKGVGTSFKQEGSLTVAGGTLGIRLDF